MTITDGHTTITTADQVNARPEFHDLPEPQRAWLARLATDPTIVTTIADAKQAATSERTTVVGGVDGQRGLPEMAFLVRLWQQNPKTIAYDPGLLTNLVRTYANQKGASTLLLKQASITQFGTQVSKIDVLVPHPGPWVKSLVGDLASCLDTVLGPDSQAYVLTDNETGLGYAEHLTAQIKKINATNENVVGYRPLAVATTTPAVTTASTSRTVQFGGVTFELGHEPQFRVVHVTRT